MKIAVVDEELGIYNLFREEAKKVNITYPEVAEKLNINVNQLIWRLKRKTQTIEEITEVFKALKPSLNISVWQAPNSSKGGISIIDFDNL